MLSSNPIALVTLPVLVFFLFLIVAIRGDRLLRLLRAGACIVTGLGLSAFFWIPAYLERGFVHTERLVLPGDLSYWKHFVAPWQLVSSPWGYGAVTPNTNEGLSFSLGIAHLALVGASIVLGAGPLRCRFAAGQSRASALPIFLGTMLVGASAFLTTTGSRPVWDHITVLQYLQFPWRLLSLAVLGVALLAGLPLACISRKTFRGRCLATGITLVLVAAMLADTWGHARPNPHWQPQPDVLALTATLIANSGVSVDLEGEFEPRWLALDPYKAPDDRVAVTRGSANVRVGTQSLTRLEFMVDAQTTARIRINIHYFEGWTVLERGNVLPIGVTSPDDLMVLDVSPGTHEFSLVFRDTLVRLAANGLSLLTTVVLLGALALQAIAKSQREKAA